MWDPWADAQDSEDLRGRLKWFLFGRVTVTSCFLGAIALLYLRTGEERYVLPVKTILALFGVEANKAASYTLLLHATLILPVVLLGLVLIWRLGLSLGQLQKSSQSGVSLENA